MKVSKGARLLVLGVVLVIVDQIIKVLVKTNMSIGDHFSVFGNWFQILFIENEGMAFGMKFGGAVGKLLLSVFRIVLSGFLCWWIYKLLRRGTPSANEAERSMAKVPTGVLVGLTIITAGAVGNILDSIFYGQIFSASAPGQVAVFGGKYAPVFFGKVVDMFYFPLIDTQLPSWFPIWGGERFRFFEPVFNFADSCVSVGAAYLVLFQYKFFSSDDVFPNQKKSDKKK